MKKTLLILAAFFVMSGCNGGGGNNNTPAPVATNGVYATTPQACGNNLPTSACVPYNNNGYYNNGYNLNYGSGGFGYYQGQNFIRPYNQPLNGCPPGSIPVVGGAPFGFVGQYQCVSMLYFQQTMGIQTAQIAGYQGSQMMSPPQGYNPQGQYQQQPYMGPQQQNPQFQGPQQQQYSQNNGAAKWCEMSNGSNDCTSLNNGNAFCSEGTSKNGSPNGVGLCVAD